MTTKEFLNQAYRIDQRINSKLEQIISLHALATKATSTLSDMPVSKTESQSKMAEIIAKIVDELQTLLELRYLCFRTWEQIAVEMNYDLSWVHRLHNRALNKIKTSH